MNNLIDKWLKREKITVVENGDVESGNKPTKDQEIQIKKFIINTPNLKDEKFHEYLETMNVNPHEAETIVYRCARNMALKLKSLGYDPLNLTK